MTREQMLEALSASGGVDKIYDEDGEKYLGRFGFSAADDVLTVEFYDLDEEKHLASWRLVPIGGTT